jgi:hypothetical protein
VIKRLELVEPASEVVVSASRDNRPVVRWRATHVMGGFPKRPFVDALFDRLDTDPEESVRYGAIRSLIEIASFGTELMSPVINGIIRRIEETPPSPAVLGEMSRAVFLSERVATPSNWVPEASRIFYALAQRAEDAVEANRWWQIASRLRVLRPDRDRRVA